MYKIQFELDGIHTRSFTDCTEAFKALSEMVRHGVKNATLYKNATPFVSVIDGKVGE